MTDGEILTAAIAGGGSFLAGLGALVKYVADRYFTQRADEHTKGIAERAEERRERALERQQDREATTAVASAMTTMALKFDSFEKQLTEVQWDVREVSGVHQAVPEPIPPPAQPPRNTPPKGVRPGTYSEVVRETDRRNR